MPNDRITRRQLLKFGALAAGLAVIGPRPGLAGPDAPQAGPVTPRAWFPGVLRITAIRYEPVPLPGAAIAKFVEPLTVFGPASGGTNPRVPGFHMKVIAQELQQQVLPAQFYASLQDPSFRAGTWVWAYSVGGRPASYPGSTVEAQQYMPTNVTYINRLPASPVLQPYLPVDQTIHWADPLNQMGSREPYSGPPPMVVHLHGGEAVSHWDGHPDAWFTPDTPGGPLRGRAWTDSVFDYLNAQEAATLWFHDHTLGATRLNVYAGLAAFYLLRDQYDTGVPGTGLNLPAGPYEIELMIQDRQFDVNGQLFFPAGLAGGLQGPPPDPEMHPYWIPMFLGDVMVVNGKSWPYLAVAPRRYRFRIVNGANARFLELRLIDAAAGSPGPATWQIASDGGLLDAPVMLNDPSNAEAARLLLAPGERADIIVDFAAYAGQTLRMVNSARAPYPNGALPDPATTAQVLEFRVGAAVEGGSDTSYDPASGLPLRGGANRPPLVVRLGAGPVHQRRQLVMGHVMGANGPSHILLNNTTWDGINHATGRPVPGSAVDGQGNWVTESPRVGATELWEIANLTADAHPVHLHLVQFQLVDRQTIAAAGYAAAWAAAFGRPDRTFVPAGGSPSPYDVPNADGALGGNPAFSPYLQGARILPDDNEAGWKDTVKAYPGQVTRFLVRWAPQAVPANAVKPGQNLFRFDPTTAPGYVWHCHILDHEDNEMMRPLRVMP